MRPSSVSNGARHQVTTALAIAPLAITRRREQRRLPEQPALARDPLRPGDPVRAVLELAGEQRRTDEEPGERRQHREPPEGVRPAGELALEVANDDVAARPGGRRQAVGERVVVVRRADREVSAERREGEDGEQPGRRHELRPVLAPGHPCHRSCSLSGATGVGRRSGAM